MSDLPDLFEGTTGDNILMTPVSFQVLLNALVLMTLPTAIQNYYSCIYLYMGPPDGVY